MNAMWRATIGAAERKTAPGAVFRGYACLRGRPGLGWKRGQAGKGDSPLFHLTFFSFRGRPRGRRWSEKGSEAIFRGHGRLGIAADPAGR